ncbi:MAG: hypothetical protein Greene07147_309 [Parcubacteria group bacterium Greene0714_7]|nr:MAG: hypothetical protein Greene07147_309 [Parcubacteria group bacterium Greene0714_7]
MSQEKAPDFLDKALNWLDRNVGRHVRPVGPRSPRE